jgi:hypothetical protein
MTKAAGPALRDCAIFFLLFDGPQTYAMVQKFKSVEPKARGLIYLLTFVNLLSYKSGTIL